MEIVPSMRVERFEQLAPGDLFINLEAREKFYALKTQRPSGEDRNFMVLLGPTFPEPVKRSWLAPWQAATVVSLGSNFSILPSLDSKMWSSNGPNHEKVSLAIAGENAYICTNGAPRPDHFYLECFVDVRTGQIFEQRPPGITAFTDTWEIAVLSANRPPQTILTFPLD